MTSTGVDRAARRRDFYSIAATLAMDGCPLGMAVGLMITERDTSPADDPSRAWTNDDLEDVARRVYAVHRQRMGVAP